MRVLVLSKKNIKLIERSKIFKSNGRLECYKCGKEIELKVGKHIVCRGSPGHRKYYHLRCAKEVFLI
ncbi:hypothetical protein [Thermofilum sp.]|uniref:hypothetical protein n=1 Tax=Thermofilum sp. TaxID=1961369 RepID=UPI003170F516